MKHPIRVALMITCVFWSTTIAHDLQAALQALAPSGQIMRLVYAKGGTPQEDNGWGNFSFTGTAVYGVSSEDGVIHKIYPSSGTGNYHCINITNDGSRVVFWNAGASQIVVVNWDGTGARSIDPVNYSATGMYDYYYDAGANSHWAILSDDNTFVKVNIDQPTAAPVTVATSAQVGGWYPGDDVGGTISDDGKYLVGDNGSGTKGFIDLTKTTRTFLSADPGCHAIARPGTPVQMSMNTCGNCTCSGSLTHGGPTIFSLPSSGNTMTKGVGYCLRDSMDAFVQRNPTFSASSCPFFDRSDGLRWLRNRDYFSTILYGSFGPLLWRTTDSKWTYIEHDVPCTGDNSDGQGATYMGDMDGQTAASFPSTSTARPQTGTRPTLLSRQAAPRTYAIDGRLLARGVKDARTTGIVIRQAADGMVTRICQ